MNFDWDFFCCDFFRLIRPFSTVDRFKFEKLVIFLGFWNKKDVKKYNALLLNRTQSDYFHYSTRCLDRLISKIIAPEK